VNRSGSTFLVNQLSKLDDFLIVPEGEVLVTKLLFQPTKRCNKKTIHTILEDHKVKQWKWQVPIANGTLPDLTNGEMFFYLLNQYKESIKPQAGILVFKAWELIHTLGKMPLHLKNQYDVRYFGLYRDVRSVACSQKLTQYKNKPLENNIVSATLIWKRFISVCRANDQLITMLKYEEMIMEYNVFFRSFLELFNTAWDPSLANRPGKVRESLPEDQITLHPHIDQQPNPSLIENWKTILSKEEIKIIQNLSHRDLAALGYECVPVSTSFLKLIFNWMKYLTGYWVIRILHPAH
jgi:hypothetical protein